jgi:hypothetical protein
MRLSALQPVQAFQGLEAARFTREKEMIKVQLEFHSVPEAIIALNAIMNLPEVKASPVVVTPGAKVAEAKARRGRADKGQKRGEYKPRTDQPAAPAAASSLSSVASQGAIPAGAPAAENAAAPVAPAEVVKAEIIKQQAEHTPVPATIGDKDAEAQKAMEALHGKKGLDACRVLLGQFGVSRIREIPTARRAEFLDQAAKAAV